MHLLSILELQQAGPSSTVNLYSLTGVIHHDDVRPGAQLAQPILAPHRTVRNRGASPEKSANAATQALGNTHSAEWRKRVGTHFNKDFRLLVVVEESERFATATPLLFRKEFEKEAKEHIDPIFSQQKLGNAPSMNQRQFVFGRAAPTLTARLLVGAEPAGRTEEEGAIALTRREGELPSRKNSGNS